MVLSHLDLFADDELAMCVQMAEPQARVLHFLKLFNQVAVKPRDRDHTLVVTRARTEF